MSQASERQAVASASQAVSDEASPGYLVRIGSDSDDLIVTTADQGDMYIAGKAGDDRLYGGSGNDRIAGGDGQDFIVGEGGDDELSGEDHNDSVMGGSGNDRIFGGNGDDILSGDEGNDLVFGGDGKDFLEGDANNDVLFGESGEDWIHGGAGDDIIFGGAGDDILLGGAGSDTFIFRQGDGDDLILLLSGLDDRENCERDVVLFADLDAEGLESVCMSANASGGADLVVRYGDHDQLTIPNHERNGTISPVVNVFRFEDGTEKCVSELLAMYAGEGGTLALSAPLALPVRNASQQEFQAGAVEAGTAIGAEEWIQAIVMQAVGGSGMSYEELMAGRR